MIDMKHLKNVKLSYLKHLKFTWFESVRGIFLIIGLLIHGIIPFIFPKIFSFYITKASKRIKEIGT